MKVTPFCLRDQWDLPLDPSQLPGLLIPHIHEQSEPRPTFPDRRYFGSVGNDSLTLQPASLRNAFRPVIQAHWKPTAAGTQLQLQVQPVPGARWLLGAVLLFFLALFAHLLRNVLIGESPVLALALPVGFGLFVWVVAFSAFHSDSRTELHHLRRILTPEGPSS